MKDIDCILGGGSVCRLTAGACEFLFSVYSLPSPIKRTWILHGDLSPGQQLYSTNNHARNLYAELTHNLSTRTKPYCNSFLDLVKRFLPETRKEANAMDVFVNVVIQKRLEKISAMVGGYDFTSVIEAYWNDYEQ